MGISLVRSEATAGKGAPGWRGGLRAAAGRCWLVGLILLALALPAQAALRLQPGTGAVDAWPAVTVLADPTARLTLDAVLDHADRFKPPGGPRANLGSRRDAVWLRAELTVDPRDDGAWVLDVDYPSLDRVEVYLLRGRALVHQAALGDLIRFDQRPWPVRSHALELQLEPGARYTLLLRVQTSSSMIVPLRLVKADRFHADDARVQVAQGLIAGIALCLALYSLAQWLGNRDRVFLYYALSVTGVALFYFAFFGLGSQHLWGASGWLTNNAAPLFGLLGLSATVALVDALLRIRDSARWLSRTLRLLALGGSLTALALLLGLVPYPVAARAATALGPFPILLAAGFAWRRARQGDIGARYVLAGWCAYSVGAVITAAMLRGLLDVNSLTSHALQAGWLCEILAFLRVLGLRSGELRQQAARATQERELMARMAHTDPLTGLPNRRGLDLALQDALGRTQLGEGLAVYVIDLDGFKQVNDSLGHDAGDQLLKAAASRLKSCLRGGDVVARLGGDEFVVLARSIRDDQVAWRLGDKLLAAFQRPCELDAGHACKVGLTVGFALAPQDGVRAADLLKRADAAMYAGKQAGKGTVRRGGASAGLVSA